MPRSHTLLLYAALLGLFVSTASAQENPDLANAKAHYIAAENAMKSGDFAKAVTEYRSAHDITKDAALLFKIATANEKADNCPEALVYYRRYLNEGEPDAEFKSMTEARIAVCEKAVAPGTTAGAAPNATPNATADAAPNATADAATEVTTDATTDAAPNATTEVTTDATTAAATEVTDVTTDAATEVTTDATADAAGAMPDTASAPPSFMDRQDTWKGKAAWASLGVSVGLATAGAILSMSASSQEQEIRNLIEFRYPNGEPAEYTGNVSDTYQSAVDKGKTHATWARIALAAAGVSAASAAVLFVLDRKSAPKDERAAHVVPVLSPESVGVSAGWRF